MRRAGSCGPVAKKFLVGIICLGLCTPGARAADLNIKSSLSESVEISDNRRLAVNPPGNSYNSVSSLMFDAKALTPTSSAGLVGNLKYLTFAGPGEEGSKNTLDKDVTVSFGKTEKRTNYNLWASYRESDLSSAQLQETGFATVTGTSTVTSVGGDIKREIGPRDTIAWSASYSMSEFSTPNSTPSDSLTSTIDWTHRLSPITVLTPSLHYQRSTYSNATQTETTFWKAMMGMSTELTKRLSFQGSAGGSMLDSNQNGVGSGANTAAQTSGSNIGWLANVQLTYRLLQTLRLSLAAARSVAPSILGDFVSSDSVNLALNYDINQVSSLSLAAAYTQQSSASGSPSSIPGVPSVPAGSSEVLSGTIAYSRQLAREWRTNMSYKHVQLSSNTGLARSNSVVLAITRDMTILP